MYHSTPRIEVPPRWTKPIRFGLCVLRYRSVSAAQYEFSLGGPKLRTQAGGGPEASQVHRDTCEASQPPVLVAKSRPSVQRAYTVAHKPRYETEHL